MKHEYHEGADAAAKFNKIAMNVFRSPKSDAIPAPKKQPFTFTEALTPSRLI
jgi:hypothetical protein